MSYFAYIFVPILLILKLGITLGNRMYVAPLEGDKKILFCNVDYTIVYFKNEMGLAYLAIFALQLIIGAEQLRVTIYEGALGAKIFNK